MDYEKLASSLPTGTISKDTIFQMAKLQNESLKPSSIHWIISHLIEKGLLYRIGRNMYCLSVPAKKRKVYQYQLSQQSQTIVDLVATRYSLVSFQVWESIQFNRFVNHLIANNITFVEVEKGLEETVFYYLREQCDQQILLCPSMDVCETYLAPDTVIVQRLVSQAPQQKAVPHHVMLEKLLVDLFAEPKMQLFLERSEFDSIFELAFEIYIINKSKMMRFARRRNVTIDSIISTIYTDY